MRDKGKRAKKKRVDRVQRKGESGGMKQTRTARMMIRWRPVEMKGIEAMCADLGMKPATYVRTIVLRDIAGAFPGDPGAKERLVEQVAEMANQVAKMLMSGEAKMEKKRK